MCTHVVCLSNCSMTLSIIRSHATRLMMLSDFTNFGGTQTGSYQTGSYQKGRFIPPKPQLLYLILCMYYVCVYIYIYI